MVMEQQVNGYSLKELQIGGLKQGILRNRLIKERMLTLDILSAMPLVTMKSLS